MKNKKFPANYKSMIEKEKKQPDKYADGKKNCYLYF